MLNLPYPSTSNNGSENGEDIRRYLFRLVEALNNAPDLISMAKAQSVSTQSDISGNQVNDLRGLIARTKNALEEEMRDLFDGIDETYLSKEDFNTFKGTYDSYVNAQNEINEDQAKSISDISKTLSGLNIHATADLSKLSNLPQEWGEESTGMAVFVGENYFVALESVGKLWLGTKLGTASQITWYEK